jgi:polyphenol oxidase
MFIRTADGVYRSSALALPWLDHGFASRGADAWPGDYVRVKQIHSNVVAVAAKGGAPPCEGDALVTAEPGVFAGIRTADCVPILLADPVRRAVAAVHAGWRGTAANIAGEAVRKLRDEFGTESKDVIAAIGPCIAECCFEVGPEVAAQFHEHFPGATNRVDLVEVNRRQLVEAGVSSGNIDISGLCTVCDPAEFHSWRRDREASGRMVSAIGIR